MKRIFAFFMVVTLLLSSVTYAAPAETGGTVAIEEKGGMIKTATGKYCIDYPDTITTNTFWDQIYIQGWVVDTNDVAVVTAWFDDRTVKHTASLYPRQDVAEAFPGYPTGKEGFLLHIPAKHFSPGTHTLHLSYTSGNGTTYTMANTGFTIKAKAEYAFAVKRNGHKYYVYDQGYSPTEVQALANAEKLSLANVDTEEVQAFLQYALIDGQMPKYRVAGQKILHADGTLTEDSDADQGIDCGFILEALDISPSKVEKHNGYVFALIDEALTDAEAASLKSTMAGEVATASDMDSRLSAALLENATCDAFRLQSGYIQKNGEIHTNTSPSKTGIIFKYAQIALPVRYAAHNGSKFYAVETVMPWHVAKAMAELMGGRLAIIPDTETQDAIHTVVKDSACFSYWLGGDDIAEEGTFRWIDGTPVNDTLRFYIGEPNNYEYREDYFMVYRDYDSAINDAGTEDPQAMTAGFILEVRDDFYTPEESFVVGDKIYVRYRGTFTKRTAELTAAALGGALIAESENTALLDKLKDSGMDGFWAENNSLFSTVSGTTYRATRASQGNYGLLLSYDLPQKAQATVAEGDKIFAIYDVSMSIDAAESFALYAGGRLAEPVTQAQNTALCRALQQGTADGYYIGMNDRNGTFTWQSGAPLSFTNWAATATDYPHNGHIAYITPDGTWVKTAHQVAGMRRMGIAVEYEKKNHATIQADAIYQTDAEAQVNFTVCAPPQDGAAKLIYGFFDADGRMVHVQTEDAELSASHLLSFKRPIPPTASSLSILLWSSVVGLTPHATAEHKVIQNKAALVPAEKAAVGGYATQGVYSIFTLDKQCVTLSENGFSETTTLTLSTEARPIFSSFRLKTDENNHVYLHSLADHYGNGKGLTADDAGIRFSDTPTPFQAEQQKDGTFLLRFPDDADRTQEQKLILIPQKALQESIGEVKNTAPLRSGAAESFSVITQISATTQVTVLGEKYEFSGEAWRYVTDGTAYGFMKASDLRIAATGLDDIPWVTGWKATTYGYNGDDNGLCAWSGCTWGNGNPSYRVIDGCHVAVPSYCVKGTAEAYANYPELAEGYGLILEVRNPANGATCYAIVADFGNFGVGNKYNQNAALDLPPNTCAALGLGQKTYDIEYRPVGKLTRWNGTQAELINAVEAQHQ